MQIPPESRIAFLLYAGEFVKVTQFHLYTMGSMFLMSTCSDRREEAYSEAQARRTKRTRMNPTHRSELERVRERERERE